MTTTFTIKLGKSPDEMTFDECMAHIRRVLFWDYIDGEWCDLVPLSDKRWEELAGYIIGAHEREILAAKAETKGVEAENAKLRRYLEILRDHGIEIVDAVAGGFEIYSKDHELADKLKGLVGQYHSAMLCMLETGIWPTDPASLEDSMRELGIDADE